MNKYDNEYLETKKEIDEDFLFIFSNGVPATLLGSLILILCFHRTVEDAFIVTMIFYVLNYVLYKVAEIVNYCKYRKRINKEE